MKLEEFQQLGKNVKVVIRKFTENPGKFASIVLQMYWDVEKERDSYKRQRDELINDIADIKRKAEAFDEIKVIINKEDVYDETIVLEVEDVVFFCETDISGGSSDE